jgi:signal transduction histidine kinase/CheY-like chemotaxis protein
MMIASAQSNPAGAVLDGPTGAAFSDRGPSATHSIELQTESELLKVAYGNLVNGALASIGGVMAFSLALTAAHPGQAQAPWVAAMAAITLYQLRLARAFARAKPDPDEVSRWSSRFVIATTLTGIAWGASAWIFPTLGPRSPVAIIHVLLLAGLATGSARLLLPLRQSCIGFLAVVMFPVAARFFSEVNPAGITAGGCVLLFIATMISAIIHNHKTLATAVTLRLEREALTRTLQAENRIREGREAELREARARAESANRAKGEFLATISHEIRTPMNGVLGMLRVVRDTPLNEDQRHYLKTASDSAESLLALLNDVLDFSKIEAGRLEIEPAPFPPSTTARAVTDLMLTRARDKGLQFDLQLSDNLPGAVIGDATRVRQILVNLIGNAIKFTERGRVELSVICAERTDSQAVLHFTVRDTGIGIDSNALEKLFKPFTQAEASMTRRYGGTGLGLAISLRLAQAMGGALQVQSTLNRGSVFRLILPCRLPDGIKSPDVADVPSFVAPALGGRVLVVEDDSVNQQVMELFLRKLNVTTSFALDGEVAVSTAIAEPFDVVLMDCQLPGIDGLEATRRIRQKLGGKPLRIIAVTANASPHVREACLAAGMDDFLTKPVRFELLASVLERNLAAQASKENANGIRSPALAAGRS